MDISADFISSVLFTQENMTNRGTTDSNNNNNSSSSSSNSNTNTTSSQHSSGEVISTHGVLPTTDIQELHLLGLHFEEFDASMPCEPIRPLHTSTAVTNSGPAEANNNHFGYPSSQAFDSPGFNCNSSYDAKCDINWTPSNTDGAIYSFEIVSDNTNASPFWEEDNLSPIGSLHQSSPFQSNAINSVEGDDRAEDTRAKDAGDHYGDLGKSESASLLLRNALLGKSSSRYASSPQQPAAPSARPNNQNSRSHLEQVFSVVKVESPSPHPASQQLVDQQQQQQVFHGELPDAAASSTHIDEILLSDFDSFAYSEEHIAQAIQQICSHSAADANLISYVPAPVTTDAAVYGGGPHHATAPSSRPARRSAKKSLPSHRAAKLNHAALSSSSGSPGNSCDSVSSVPSASPAVTLTTSNCAISSSCGPAISNGSGGQPSDNGICDISEGKDYCLMAAGKEEGGGNGVNSSSSGGGGGGGGVSSNTNGCAIGIRKERSLHHCFVCNKGFKDKYSVTVHIRTHTGEKPFSCTVCGKRFRQKAHLAKHQHTHFQKKPLAPSPTSPLMNTVQPTVIKVTATSSILEPNM